MYIGDGTQAIPLGSIDATFNGRNGQKLRVNLGSDFQNPGFETGSIAPWTVMNQNIDLGVTEIAGYTVIDQSTYPSTCNGNTNNANCPPTEDKVFTGTTYMSAIDTTQFSEGTRSLRLWTPNFTFDACAVVHGPAVYSNAFDAAGGDTLYFDWKAANGGDAFHVYGYLLNTATGAQTKVLDEMQQYDGLPPTPWTQAAAVVPVTGTYRFVFVSGTFDASCGRVAGASLYLDNFQVYGSGKIDDAVLSKVAELLTYENRSDDPPATRSVVLTAVNDANQSATGTIVVNILPVNDPPVGTPMTREWENTPLEDVFADLTGTLAFTDPDDIELSYGVDGGTPGVYEIAGVEYDVMAVGTFGTLYVDTETGAYRLVADAAAVNAVVVNPESETFTVTAFDGTDIGSTTLTLGVLLPPSPRNVTGVPGNGQVTVSWDQPIEAAGVNGYVVTASPGGATCTTVGVASTTCTVTGLTNGQPYTFVVTTDVGTPSLASGPVIPVGPPTAPQNPTATPGDGRVLVEWSPPANDGGSAITGYTVTTSPGGATCTTAGATNCTVLGLATGSTYSFTVTATTALGTGPASAPVSATLKFISTVSLGAAPTAANVGDPVTLTATVSGSSPSGSVEFFDGASSLGSVAVAGGSAALVTSALGAGPHSVTAVYSGDASHYAATSNAVSVAVTGVASVSVSVSDVWPVVGDAVVLTASVAGSSPSGSVEFFAGATSLGSVVLSGGVAELSVDSLAVGDHSVTVVYSGDTYNTGAASDAVSVTVRDQAAASLTVSHPAPLSGTPVVFTMTVSGTSPTGTVEFFDGATSLGTAVLTDGVAELKVLSLSVGDHSVTAVYSGDTYNTGQNAGPVTLVVRAVPTLAVSSTPSAPVVGGEVTLSVRVTGVSPTGTVEFRDGSTRLGVVQLVGGTAQLKLSSLAVGTHQISVVYSGDTYHLGATSAASQVVIARRASTTSLGMHGANGLTGQLRVVVGQPVQLRAGVGGVQPSGSVEFQLLDASGAFGRLVQSVSSGQSLGTATIHNGVAQLTVESLPVGTYRIVADYAGDATHLPSSSTLVQVDVLPLPSPAAPSATVLPGQPIPVAGSGYEPGSTVKIMHDGVVVATVVVDANGSFSTDVQLPLGATGSQQLTIVGVDPTGDETSAAVVIEVAGTLPSTGGGRGVVNLALPTLLAGLMLVLGSRRRLRVR